MSNLSGSLKHDWEHLLSTSGGATLMGLIDALYCEFLKSENRVDLNFLDLDAVYEMRRKWLACSDRIEDVIEQLTKIAEGAHTDEEVEAAITRLRDRLDQAAPREETVPW